MISSILIVNWPALPEADTIAAILKERHTLTASITEAQARLACWMQNWIGKSASESSNIPS